MKHESAIGTSRMVLCIDRIKMLAGGVRMSQLRPV